MVLAYQLHLMYAQIHIVFTNKSALTFNVWYPCRFFEVATVTKQLI